MSSYKQPYTPTHYNEYIPTLSASDFKLGLQIKQQQFDQGWKSLQDSVNKTEDINVYRDEDKEYVKQKQNEIVSNINKYSNLDLGDARNVYQLTSQITPIYKDKRILDAVEDTGKISLLQKNIQELEKNHPDRYSELNKSRDLRAIQSYINNPNSRYSGSTTPTIYTDYKKTMLGIGSQLKPEIYTDPKTGQKITGVSSDRILALLPAEAKHQMDIDLEESGALMSDANKIKLHYAEKNAQLEAYQKKLTPNHPDYLETQKLIDDNNEIINSKDNDDVIVNNYNSHQKQKFYKEYADGVAYTQAVTSPEKLQQNSQAFQRQMQNERLHDKRIQDAWVMGYDVDQYGNYHPTKYPKLGGKTTTKQGYHFKVDSYVEDLKNQGDTIDLVAKQQEIPILKEGNIITKIGRIVKEGNGYTVYTHKIDSSTGADLGGVTALKDVSLSGLRDMYDETRRILPGEFNEAGATPETGATSTNVSTGTQNTSSPTDFNSDLEAAKESE